MYWHGNELGERFSVLVETLTKKGETLEVTDAIQALLTRPPTPDYSFDDADCLLLFFRDVRLIRVAFEDGFTKRMRVPHKALTIELSLLGRFLARRSGQAQAVFLGVLFEANLRWVRWKGSIRMFFLVMSGVGASLKFVANIETSKVFLSAFVAAAAATLVQIWKERA